MTMAKKRKTYYLDEETIHKVKTYAHEQNMSENDTFEKAVEVYEKFMHDAEMYQPIPKTHKPILLEAIDNMIYQSQRILETSWPDPQEEQTIRNSLSARIAYLKNIRNLFLP